MGTDLHVTADLVRKLRAGLCLVARDGRVLAASVSAAERLGWPGGCPEGARLGDLLAAADAQGAERVFNRMIDGGADRAEVLARLRSASDAAPVPLGLEAVRESGRTVAILLDIGAVITPYGAAMHRDPDARTEAQIRAEADRAPPAAEPPQRTLARITALAERATVGLFEIRRHPGGTIDIPNATSRFCELVGERLPAGRGERPDFFAGIHAADLAQVRAALERSQATRAAFDLRYRQSHPTRGTLWLEVTAAAPETTAGVASWLATLRDVTAEVRREEELRNAYRAAEEMREENERHALYDELTGLPNRSCFDKRLGERVARAQASGPRDCTLVRLDLDRFRHVNDTLGHAAGDKLLTRVADVLRASVRPGDLASRNGGDEFSILLAPGTTLDQARAIVERVQAGLAVPLIHDGRQCRFGVSFGIAESADILETGSDIHLFADAALDGAKIEGGNRAKVFSPGDHSRILRDRGLAIDLHDALEHDQLIPYFQPQIAAADGGLYGAEVLLRWAHPTDGILAPDAFLHVAEHLRLVPDIDRAVMAATRKVLTRWRDAGLRVPKISFNISAARMRDPDIVEAAAAFAETDTRVTFELLESILIEEESQAFRDNLSRIRAAGVDIEIDDFGSGHASIIGVMEILPSALKIDQRIIFPVAEDARARDLVGAIVRIAKALNISTVAEGVETADHARILRDLGCDVLQGYHFARPLSETQFRDFMVSHPASPS